MYILFKGNICINVSRQNFFQMCVCMYVYMLVQGGVAWKADVKRIIIPT